MNLKMILIVCMSFIVIMSIGAISASEDIANDNVTVIEQSETISQAAEEITPADEIISQATDDEINSADNSDEILADDEEFEPEVITPKEFYGMVFDVKGDVIEDGDMMLDYSEIFSVGEKFNIGINATPGVSGTFRVYYAGINDFGLFKWNDTVLASSKITDGIGIVELSFPNAGGLYDFDDYTYLWMEYNTTKGNGHLEYWVKIIENPKSINATVSPLTLVEGEKNVTLKFSSPVGGYLEVYRDGVNGFGTIVRLDKLPTYEIYQNTTVIDDLSVGNHTIRVYFEPYDSADEDMYRYSKTFNVEVKKYEPKIVQTATKITSSSVSMIYNTGSKNVTFTLKDVDGRVLSNLPVTVTFNGKTYDLVTNAKGQASISASSNIVPKTYYATCEFAGDESYKASTVSAKVTVKKATPQITAKAKAFKKSVKTKKYTITLKTNQNKVMKNTKVTLKVNKKTYSATTNAKGQATFKITKLTKKGKYTATVKYAGNKYYNAKSVSAKITVK